MQTLMRLKATLGPAVVTLAAASLALSLSACSDAAGTPAPDKARPTPVSVAAVLEKQVAETQEFSGRLEAIEQVQVRPRVPGFITSVNFQPGAEVRKGQLLYQIDQRPFQAEADRAEAAAAAAQAKAALAGLELRRAETLLGDRAIAQREYDERVAVRHELDATARAVAAQAAAARLNLTYTRVLSPIDGRAGKDEFSVGSLVDSSAVLTSVVSLKRIYASFDGDEETYLRVARRSHSGAPVTVRVGLAGETGFPHQGRLQFIDNALDARTGSVRLRAVLGNEDGSLAPGLFARVQISSGQPAPALVVSERAVGTDQDRKFVFVLGADGLPERRPVVLGPLAGGLRVVRTGLKAGEMVVVNGVQRVRPGVKLAPVTVPMDDAGVAAPAAGAMKG